MQRRKLKFSYQDLQTVLLVHSCGCFGSPTKDFTLDILGEEHQLSDIVHDAKSTGAVMIGGGISKHHTIWWNQFRDGLDYAVQVTTAPEWDGSLSGARVREAVSWGKVRSKARRITVEGDATVLFTFDFWSFTMRAIVRKVSSSFDQALANALVQVQQISKKLLSNMKLMSKSYQILEFRSK